MSSNATKVEMVSISKSEYDALKLKSQSDQLGSVVLLRNVKNEEKFTLHGNLAYNEELHTTIGKELSESDNGQVQLDFSMNQSIYLKHDRLDPIGVKKAPAFWVDINSDFTVETGKQHLLRDPSTFYDMFAKGEQRDYSVAKYSELVKKENVA